MIKIKILCVKKTTRKSESGKGCKYFRSVCTDSNDRQLETFIYSNSDADKIYARWKINGYFRCEGYLERLRSRKHCHLSTDDCFIIQKASEATEAEIKQHLEKKLTTIREKLTKAEKDHEALVKTSAKEIANRDREMNVKTNHIEQLQLTVQELEKELANTKSRLKKVEEAIEILPKQLTRAVNLIQQSLSSEFGKLNVSQEALAKENAALKDENSALKEKQKKKQEKKKPSKKRRRDSSDKVVKRKRRKQLDDDSSDGEENFKRKRDDLAEALPKETRRVALEFQISTKKRGLGKFVKAALYYECEFTKDGGRLAKFEVTTTVGEKKVYIFQDVHKDDGAKSLLLTSCFKGKVKKFVPTFTAFGVRGIVDDDRLWVVIPYKGNWMNKHTDLRKCLGNWSKKANNRKYYYFMAPL